MRLAAATLATVAWGTFAFGSVYPWAFIPLAIACALVGLAGLARGRHEFGADVWLIFTALAAIVVLGIVQVIPLPQWLLVMLSPATHRFLNAYDLSYAFAAARSQVDPSFPAGPVWHSLSIAPFATWRAVGLLVAFALLLFGLVRALTRDETLHIGKGLVLVGTALALVGIVQKAILGDGAWDGMKIYGFWAPKYPLTTPYGPYVNKNHFAGWMLMVLPITFALAMSTLERSAQEAGAGLRRRLLWLSSPGGSRLLMLTFAALLMSLSLVMTRSRSGLACFLAIAIVAGMFAGRRLGSRRSGLAIASALVLLLLTAMTWAGGETALGRVAESDSVQLRLNIWRVAMAIARDFPVLGSGLDTFGIATMIYQPPGGDQHYQEAHNDYLQILAEGGVVALLATALAIFGLARGIVRRFREPEADADAYWLRVGATIGLLAIALQSAVEFSLQMPGNAALFTVLVAMALTAGPRSHDPRPSSPEHTEPRSPVLRRVYP